MIMEASQSQTQLLLLVNGTAGTGKSHTICAISHALPAKELVRCAATANPAGLIRGSTIHREFYIPVMNS